MLQTEHFNLVIVTVEFRFLLVQNFPLLEKIASPPLSPPQLADDGTAGYRNETNIALLTAKTCVIIRKREDRTVNIQVLGKNEEALI